MNYRCVIDNFAPVRIGAKVGLGIGVQLITSSHATSDPTCRAGAMTFKPIVIEDGAWVGSGAIILQGVVVGKGSVVAAGSVVTRDVGQHTVVAGIPARPLRILASG